MTAKKKIILVGSGLLLISAVFYWFSQDSKKKKYNRTVVPPDYVLRLINQKNNAPMESQLDKERAFADLLMRNPDKVDFAIKAVEAYLKSTYHLRNDYCQVCYGKLTENDILLMTSHDFNRVCEDHRKYAGHYQLSIVRKELDIKDRDPFLERIKKEFLP